MGDMRATVAAAESWLSGVGIHFMVKSLCSFYASPQRTFIDQCAVFCTKYSLHNLGHWISCQQDAIARLSEEIDRDWCARLSSSSDHYSSVRRLQRNSSQSALGRRGATSSLQELPRTVLQQIAQFLPVEDRVTLSLTCRRLLDVCRSKSLWNAQLPFSLTRHSVRLLYGARYLTAATSLEVVSPENDAPQTSRHAQRKKSGRGRHSETLSLVATPQTDDQLLSLATKLFPDVESLQFYSTESDGSSLPSLINLNNLRELELGITNLDDAHFKKFVTAQEPPQPTEAELSLESSWFSIRRAEYQRVLGVVPAAEKHRRSCKKKKEQKKNHLASSAPAQKTQEHGTGKVPQDTDGTSESTAFLHSTGVNDDSHQIVSPTVMSARIPTTYRCFESLRKLSLYCCDALTGASLAAVLSQLKSLQSFCVVSPDTSLDLTGLAHLSPCCEELYIDTKSRITAQTLSAVLQRCRHLQALALCPFPPSHLAVVSKHGAASISVLCLQHCNSTSRAVEDERGRFAISSADLKHLETAAFLPQLEELQLGNLSATRGLEPLCRAISKASLLRNLSLGYAHFDTPLLFKTMQLHNKNITSLTLRRCTFPLILTDKLVEYFDDEAEQRQAGNADQQGNSQAAMIASHRMDVLTTFASAIPTTVKDLGLLDYTDEMSGDDLLRFAVRSPAASFDFSRSTALSGFNQREKALFEQLLQRTATRAVSLRGCLLPPFSQTIADFCVASHSLLERLTNLYQ